MVYLFPVAQPVVKVMALRSLLQLLLLVGKVDLTKLVVDFMVDGRWTDYLTSLCLQDGDGRVL